MTKLSRERVLKEIDHLAREIADLIDRIGDERANLSQELQQDIDELENSIVLAKRFTNENVMDFRRVEFGLMQLRTLKAQIQRSLNGTEV
jgi:Mg2+ and Co2+ transporter CorA